MRDPTLTPSPVILMSEIVDLGPRTVEDGLQTYLLILTQYTQVAALANCQMLGGTLALPLVSTYLCCKQDINILMHLSCMTS